MNRSRLDRACNWLGFGFAGAAILGGPWLFGAWEAWWFWPFALCIFFSTFCFGIRLSLMGREPNLADPELNRDPGRGLIPTQQWMVFACCAVFLAYAAVRFLTTRVYQDAERSLLLFLTPALLGAQIVFGWRRRQWKLLAMMVSVNLFLLGVYGAANHLLTGSAKVLWAPGYEGYYSVIKGEGRASGSYFCPDHFSGAMEIAFCLGLGLLLDREQSGMSKAWGAALALVGLWGVVIGQSRGGGLTVLVVSAAAMVWGFGQWPPLARWCHRVSLAAVAAIVVLVFVNSRSGYLQRFHRYYGWSGTAGKPLPEMVAAVRRQMPKTSRGRMIGGALRAWKTSPVFGIGAGMHPNLWPRFAATADGDRETRRWPTLVNEDFHSYEVHSDWVQLLEEYGAVGLGLFLLAAGAIAGTLIGGIGQEARERRKNDWRRTGRRTHAAVLGGLLSIVAMAFHSFGDFNLQMPGTVWMLGAIVSVSLAFVLHDRVVKTRRRRAPGGDVI